MFKCYYLDTLSCFKFFVEKPCNSNIKRQLLINFANCIKEYGCYKKLQNMINLNVIPCYYFAAVFLSLLKNEGAKIPLKSDWDCKLLLPTEGNFASYNIQSGLRQVCRLNHLSKKKEDVIVLYALRKERLQIQGPNKDKDKDKEQKEKFKKYIKNYKGKIISNTFFCQMAKDAKMVIHDCLFDHVFLYLGNDKIVGTNFPEKEFIYDDVKNVLKFTEEGMMYYSYLNKPIKYYYLFASNVNIR